MKKFITAILSLVLAGTLTAGLAACGGNGGGGGGNGGQTEEQKWATMVEGLKNLNNYTATSSGSASQGIKYNGEYVTADTVYSEDEEEQMMKQMFVGMVMQMLGMDENPYGYEETRVSYADFANGKYAETSYHDAEKLDYVLADGTSVKEYNWYDDDGYYVSEYKGYKNAAQAKEAVRVNINPLAYMLTMEFSGVGDKADVKGTIPEIYQLFTYNSAKSAYVAQLGTVDIDMVPEGTPISIEIKVSNGAVVGYVADIALDMSVADMAAQFMDADDGADQMPDMSAMYEGLSIELGIFEEITISNIGSTTVNVPEDLDTQIGDSYTSYVIADEDTYKAMFEGLLGDDGTIKLSYDNYPESCTAYYDADANILKILTENYSTGEKTAKFYWATDSGLKVYTAIYNTEYGYAEFESWSELESETISGSKADALISKLPAEMQLYFNLNGKHMSEQFDLFEVSYYNNYKAEITFNEKPYNLSFGYNYNESTQKLEFSQYALDEIVESGDHYVSSYDVYVYVSAGDMQWTDGGYPEVAMEEVTEEAWKAVVEPWYNLKNVTVTNGSEKTFVVVADDGSSGKIYHVENTDEYSWYIEFTKVGNDYTVTRYSYVITDWASQTGHWVKSTDEGMSYNDILDAADLSAIKNLGGAIFWVDDSYKTIGDLWASVEYNPMTKTYEIVDQFISVKTVNGKLVYGGSTLSNKGTTVVGELPAEVAAAEDIKAQYAGEYKDTENDAIVLTLNADGTFTLVGLDEDPSIEGTWSVDSYGNFTFDATDTSVWLMVTNYDSYNNTIAMYANSETLNLQKVEA